MFCSYTRSKHQKYFAIGFSLIASQTPKNKCSNLLFILSKNFSLEIRLLCSYLKKGKERKKEIKIKPLFLKKNHTKRGTFVNEHCRVTLSPFLSINILYYKYSF